MTKRLGGIHFAAHGVIPSPPANRAGVEMNRLYFGDNLDVLRRHIKDESVDLIYLDPPFNSSATYNVLFKEQGEAQAEAFRDTWGWGEAAAIAYEDIIGAGNDLSLLMRTFRAWLGESSMTAYLAMMAIRLAELKRVLKPDGSIYLHCDPTASHYLKLLLDAVFSARRFRNEIIWKRTSAHSAAKRWNDVHDSILFYTASELYKWNEVLLPHDPEYIARYKNVDEKGRRWADDNLTGPGIRRGESGAEWRGFNPTQKSSHWKVSNKAVIAIVGEAKAKKMGTLEKLDTLDAAGLIHWPKSRLGSGASFPRFKRTLSGGAAVTDVITDIPPLNSQAQERLGYPTQKPISLLERIIRSSSDEGQVILDPFCGCGTSVEAAESLKRNWIGIDVTHYAITLIEKRLKNIGSTNYEIGGRPADLAGAADLARRDKHQFQWWAAWLLGAQTYESKKGADRGIDANIFFSNGPFGFGRIIISVKGGENISPICVRELAGVVDREKAEMGILVTLNEPTKAMRTDAIGCGFVGKSAHGRLPKIQIATIADLLDKRFPKLPPLPRPLATAPRSKAAKDRDQLELLLPFKTTTVVTEDGAFVDPRWIKTA